VPVSGFAPTRRYEPSTSHGRHRRLLGCESVGLYVSRRWLHLTLIDFHIEGATKVMLPAL
jgi:hypothetical protein